MRYGSVSVFEPWILQETSFQEFCDRPENREVIQKQHERQVQRYLRIQQNVDAATLKDKVC